MDRRKFLRRLTGMGAAAIAAPVGLGTLTRSVFATNWRDDDPRVVDPNLFRGAEVFDRLLKTAGNENWSGLPIGDIMGRVAMELRGTPYVGATLELSDDREQCSVNLLGLDCVTLFETALGFARMLKHGGSTPAALIGEITFTRYRGGRLTDYTSRLHYTTDWIHDNVEKGVVVDITPTLPGAAIFERSVNFMSTHPGSYSQLKAHPEFVPIIAGMERTINSRVMRFVPKEKIAAAEASLQTGDIVGTTTTINGIDISHTGLCYRDEKNVLRFLHASLTRKQVTLDDRLSVYVGGVSKHTGIMVARPVWRSE